MELLGDLVKVTGTKGAATPMDREAAAEFNFDSLDLRNLHFGGLNKHDYLAQVGRMMTLVASVVKN